MVSIWNFAWLSVYKRQGQNQAKKPPGLCGENHLIRPLTGDRKNYILEKSGNIVSPPTAAIQYYPNSLKTKGKDILIRRLLAADENESRIFQKCSNYGPADYCRKVLTG